MTTTGHSQAQGATARSSQSFEGLTILIADDHHLVREGLKLCVMSVEPGTTVIEAETLASAIDQYRANGDVDLVLLDLSMPDCQNVLDEFTRSCPDARVVIVSATYDMKTVQSALAKGVLGFIPKRAGKGMFVNALRFVLDGGTYVPPEALLPSPPAGLAPMTVPVFGVPAQLARTAGPQSVGLTARQIDVLAQLLDGKPNKQICRELNLALGTVKCHVGAILGALEVNSRAEAIAAANKRGWRQWIAPTQTSSRQVA